MSAPDGPRGPGLSAWLEPRAGERALEIGPGTGHRTLDVVGWGAGGPAGRRAQNDGLMVSRRSGTRLGGFARVDRTAASRPTEIEVS